MGGANIATDYGHSDTKDLVRLTDKNTQYNYTHGCTNFQDTEDKHGKTSRNNTVQGPKHQRHVERR